MRFFILLFLFIVPLQQAHGQIGWTKSFDNGLVVTADKYASEVGRQILQQGGNAVDAAVAVQFALAVTLPRAGNIGGGGFMVVYLASGEVTALDFREKAPAAASPDMYIRNGKFDQNLSWEGPLAVGVPGTVDGMINAHTRYGKLPLKTVLEPAIQLARKGYILTYSQASDMNAHAERFKKFEAAANYFTKKNGKPFEEGERFVQEDLASTLEKISQKGRDGFYSGSVGDAIVREMKKAGGLITREDLSHYESKWREPVHTSFRGYDVYIMPPPSSGSIAIAQILAMIDDYPLEKMGHNSANYIHVVAEAMRRAFADRAYFLGDPDFWDIPQAKLLTKEYNRQRMESFSTDSVTTSASLSHGIIPEYHESNQTTHFSIIDTEGNAVAVTTTLNGSFGSHVAIGGAGFLLNNEMDDFSSQPGIPNAFGLIGGEANAIKPGKRMLSSMSPAIVAKDGKARMVLGAAGGPKIITATLQCFLNKAVFGMNAQQAISAPRFHHQWLPDVLFMEPYALNPDTRIRLEKMGYTIKQSDYLGRGHIIFVDDKSKLTSGTDPRGDGFASGY